MATPTPFEILERFAPGTRLRNAVDLILRQGTGALVILGTGQVVDAVSSGGFRLSDCAFSEQRLAELAKMDGGIVVDPDAELIVRANIHFIPDPGITTVETGTRFRTAERLAIQTGKPILAVSEEGRSAAIVFTDAERYELQNPTTLLAQANQNLNSLERLRRRLEAAEDRLTRLEVEDVAALRDAVVVIQRAALVDRLAADIQRTSVELGGEAHLIQLQAADLVEGVAGIAELVYADYRRRRPRGRASVLDRLAELSTPDLFDARLVASAIDLTPLDSPVGPRGLRALALVPRLPEPVKDALLAHFGDFQKMLHASVVELDEVEGIGRARAQQLRTYFDRIAEVGGGVWEIHE
jgi:diadenylate cyclase